MIHTLIVISNSSNPYNNHTIEEILLTEFKEYSRIFFMWKNEPSIVFGRNQNPWKEIYVNRAVENGVHLIRRLSGGGTVYHDLGNLNFSFIESNGRYDEYFHFEMIIDALKQLGINLELNKRKDLLIEGKKVSGNAFYLKGNRRLHHGTLLVSSDLSRLWGLLKRKESKIITKGISSVTSEVTSLKAYKSDLTIQAVQNKLVDQFYRMHENEVDILTLDEIVSSYSVQHKNITERLKSWAWTYGETPPFVYKLDESNQVKIANGYVEEIIGFENKNIGSLSGAIRFNDQFKEV